jgi:hypothetical protein
MSANEGSDSSGEEAEAATGGVSDGVSSETSAGGPLALDCPSASGFGLDVGSERDAAAVLPRLLPFGGEELPKNSSINFVNQDMGAFLAAGRCNFRKFCGPAIFPSSRDGGRQRAQQAYLLSW